MWRGNLKATSGLAALLVAGLAGCVDLQVANPNAPGEAQVLATASDVQSLLGGTYTRWLYAQSYDGPTMFLSNAAGQHAAPWANSGMEYYARIPRNPTVNSPGDANITNLTNAWTQSYRVLAAVHDGLQMVDSGKVSLGSDEARARAFGRYMQGLALGTVALLYDSAFVYDETMNPLQKQPFKGYQDAMNAALGFLADAATIASANTFTIPSSWMSQSVSSAKLAQLAHTYAAIYRAAVARTPAERQAVNWAQVVADANAGITSDWQRTFDLNTCAFSAGCDIGMYYLTVDGWEMQNNWVLGMADQSGKYQSWVSAALTSKQPFRILTPDTRWPQGTTDSAQRKNPGDYFIDQGNDQGTWARPDRGTWRWSYYGQTKEPYYTAYSVDLSGSAPEVAVEELKMLKAEAAYYASDFATVASLVNATRTQHGLAATDAAGTNSDCVPKLPNGSCGNLWEMLKWEKRLETLFLGPLAVGFYFDSRGWGDLMQGTILQFPVPYREMQILQQSPYNYGGVGGSYGAPVGSYGY
jgi:hypothetical protein